MGILKKAVIVVILGIAIRYLLKSRQDFPVPQKIDGYVKEGFEEVKNIFKQNFDSGYEEEGAAFAVCYRGELVVDLWGGFADKMALREWTQDTMTTAFSTTKAAVAVVIALLVDRGLLDYDELVIKYWPEFGAHGKANITLKMLMSHEAGLVALDGPITLEAVADRRKMSKLFEDQMPNWPPGATACYHMITIGWLCDQLVHRVDPQKRSLGQFFHEEIAKPFGIDFYIGLPRDQVHRVARVSAASLWDTLKRMNDWQFVQFMYSMIISGFTGNWPEIDKASKNPDWLHLSEGGFKFNDPDIQQIEIPAGNGIGTARAIAQLLCLLDESKFISKATRDKIIQPIPHNYTFKDPWMNITWSWGFMFSKNPDGADRIGHDGYGGQQGKFDPKEHLAFGYLRNHMAPDMGMLSRTFNKLEKATYDIIKKMKTD